ncbi:MULTISPECIES: DUF1800 domain-containing protein [unclassified Micromonospora]|uniref:DUF1800 domain-containing protein n=1 Tax=unclassified Micromonospora TaxID=2617518 RepID=UPI001C24274B|nr:MULTISPECIES: DUF1800 domain-containing protein [unclassified Micromonospora]MBU8861604.1 DUF1800 domain-containing protein [Micromonospora sp. WMMB482]MDM4777890.1 DUF1800 domain-containing protein [Micromonospora sp. b486]MDM4781172.1 DUF1800 domain-containing protein [Micromonospora sp. b486]
MNEREAVAHLLRRATFGPTAEEVDAAERDGFASTLDRLIGPDGRDRGAAATPVPVLGPDPAAQLDRNATREQRQQANQQRREQITRLLDWWLGRMTAAEHQLTEKLLFFWHGHWATSVQKVRSAPMMSRQLETLRRLGLGPLPPLVDAMVRDPALIRWLDGQRNTRQAPNENLARELMELFTLGIGDGYSEADVREGARALTGWTIDRRSGQARFEPRRHDPGPKTILGVTAAFDARSYARLLAERPETSRFVAGRLWFRFAGPHLPPPDGLAGADTAATLRRMFTAPDFARTRDTLVKQPVEWLVGATRQLGIRPSALPENRRRQLVTGLSALEQVPLRPPSVGGWPSGTAWLTTSSAQARLRVAGHLAGAAAPAVLSRLAAAPRDGRPDALARLLVVDRWSERTRAVLAPLAGEPRRLIIAGLVSPEYTVS